MGLKFNTIQDWVVAQSLLEYGNLAKFHVYLLTLCQECARGTRVRYKYARDRSSRVNRRARGASEG